MRSDLLWVLGIGMAVSGVGTLAYYMRPSKEEVAASHATNAANAKTWAHKLGWEVFGESCIKDGNVSDICDLTIVRGTQTRIVQLYCNSEMNTCNAHDIRP